MENAALVVRVVLLTILLWAAMIFAASTTPLRESTAQEFKNALTAHRVTFVSYELTEKQNVVDVHWSTGGLAWYRVYDLGPYSTEDLFAAAPAIHPELRERHSGGDGLFPDWPFNVPATAGWLAGAAWIVTLLLMWNTAELRFANRWAWFWMFTFGQVGAILFLLLEPRSLWYATHPQAPRPARMTGGNGCLTSIGLSLVAFLAAGLFAAGVGVFH